MTIVIKTKGDREVLERLKNLEQSFPEHMKKALFEEAFNIFEESQERVPVDTGRLLNSGVVGERGSTRQPVVIIAYGTNYALPVHERHPTKAKYLEEPFVEAMDGMPERLARRVERMVERGL